MNDSERVLRAQKSTSMGLVLDSGVLIAAERDAKPVSECWSR
jgi:hypothetical protein